MAGADRIRLWLAPGICRHRHSRAHSGFRGNRARREDRVVGRAKGDSVAKGLRGNAGQVHRAIACSFRQGSRASAGSTAQETGSCSSRRGAAVSCMYPRFAWAVACLLLASTIASAHEARPAYLEIKETAPGQFTVLWRTPVLAGMRLPVVLKLPDDVKDLREPNVQELADSFVERRWIDAGPNGLAGKRIEFPGLQFTITDVLVRAQLLDGRKLTTIVHPPQPDRK